ncbi:MAG: hypothetical protein [Bacteriophage sp.]|nr:MAG: hypothetical protein [Bacteriophage sp.]
MKQKFIEWFTKGNNGCAPSINADGSFEHEKTQHMFEAYQAGMAESDRKVEQLAAENAGLKSAFDKPDAWLSWHSIPPTFYEPDRGGEYLQVHEKAGEKNDDGSDSWPVYRKPETETPATDAFLAEVRAQGVDVAIEHLINKFEGTGRIGVPVMALEWLAQELRKGVQS